MDKIRFNEGEVIFKEGEFGKVMYEVYSGTVEIISEFGTEDAKNLTELKKGGIFGEMAIIDISPRSTTAVAKTDVQLLEIPESKLGEYFKKNPDKILAIMKNISGRIRALTTDYAEVCEALNDAGKKKTEGLFSRLRKFAGIYSKNEKALKRYEERKAKHIEPLAGILDFYKAGDIIFKEGEEGKCMYDIHTGIVGIYKGYGTPDQKLLVQLDGDAFFGEMGMLENEKRSATAVALEDTSIERIYAENLYNMFAENPAKIMLILQHLTDRLRRLTIDYIRACKTAADMVKAEEEKSELEPETKEWLSYFGSVSIYGRYYT